MNPIWFPGGKKSHIAVFDDIISTDLIEKINQRILGYRNSLFKRGETGGGFTPRIKLSWDLRLTEEGFAEVGGMPHDLFELELELAKQLNPCIGLYEQEYFDVVPDDGWQDSGFQYQLYEKGLGYYRPHTDGGSVIERSRVLTVIIYMNTVEKGGGTGFPLHEVMVDAVAGRVCIFPADWTMPHQGLMPLSSDKMIINTFLKGNVHGTDHHH
jgi:hypothetical protein